MYLEYSSSEAQSRISQSDVFHSVRNKLDESLFKIDELNTECNVVSFQNCMIWWNCL